MDPVQFNVLLI